VKQETLGLGLPLFQPRNVNDPTFVRVLQELRPDLLIVAAYGQILEQEVLEAASWYPLNLHASLLPRYRGAAPVQRVLVEGETETGVTVQRVRLRVDSGEIAGQRKVAIDFNETSGELMRRLSRMGATLLLETVKQIAQHTVTFLEQDERLASYAPCVEPSEGGIKWAMTAIGIHNLVRGLNPKPGAHTWAEIGGKRMRVKVWRTSVVDTDRGDGTPGAVVGGGKNGPFRVQAGEGTLTIDQLQLPGKRVISGSDFARGYDITAGFRFSGGADECT